MSKELDKEVREYYERTYHVMIEGAEYAYEMGCNPQFPDPYSVQAAFTAGRALGRREMKGEAIGHINALASAWAPLPIPIIACSRLIAAIEATPEEV